jgi:hypothetical protein
VVNEPEAFERLFKTKYSSFEKNWSKFMQIIESSIDDPENKENIASAVSKAGMSLNPDVFLKGAGETTVNLSSLESKVMNVVYANIDQSSKILNVIIIIIFDKKKPTFNSLVFDIFFNYQG